MEFEFYLDAWKYCYKSNIPLSRISRKTWKIWFVDELGIFGNVTKSA